MSKATATNKAAKRKTRPVKETEEALPMNSATTVMRDEVDDGLEDLFLDSIKDIYWAENHLVKTLPRMINAAASEALKNAISSHLEQTKKQVERLNQVFDMLGKRNQAKKCDAMEGITKEGEGIVEDTDTGTRARDTGVIMASQKVEYYEIATYRGIIQLADKLGYSNVASLLEQTLAEENETSETLAMLAEGM